MFDHFEEHTRRALFFARYEASRRGCRRIEPEHLLLGMLREDEETVAQVLASVGAEAEAVRRELEGGPVVIGRIAGTADLPLSPASEAVLEAAGQETARLSGTVPEVAMLLVGILRHGDNGAARLLQNHGLTLAHARSEAARLSGERGRDGGDAGLDLLRRFGCDLTELAAENAFDPLIGREDELERVVEVLARRTKNNPLLLGEPGVGKTALVEGLAQRIAEGRVPACLADKRLFRLEVATLVAGTRYRGQFEERLRALLAEVRGSGRILLFLDEVHTLVGAGAGESPIDAAAILKPALARGELSVIGATTPAESLRFLERDRALQRRFEPVRIAAPGPEATAAILRGVAPRYEAFHGVRYDDDALRAAVEKTGRYLADRQFPDKALDVLDQAGARVKVRAAADGPPPRVGAVEVDAVVARITGIPVERIAGDELQRLQGIEAALRRRVVGQDEALAAVSRAVRRARLGVGDPERPVGSFLFLGPPGVGKTEVARRLAQFLFGTTEALVRFDMSELTERHSVSKLIGAPPGYVGYEGGGQLTEKVRRRPYSLVLFDEIEKAHPEVVNLLLQVLEDGALTDSLGHRVDFRHALVLLTSNLGSRALVKGPGVGFGTDDAEAAAQRVRRRALDELERAFRPELVDRLDEVIVFRSLGRPELQAVLDLLIDDLDRVLARQGLRVLVTPRARDWMLDEAQTDRAQGARPLRRILERRVHDAVSLLLIERLPERPRLVRVDAQAGGLVLDEVTEEEAEILESEVLRGG